MRGRKRHRKKMLKQLKLWEAHVRSSRIIELAREWMRPTREAAIALKELGHTFGKMNLNRIKEENHAKSPGPMDQAY